MSNDKGFTYIPVVLVVLAAIALSSTVIPVKRTYNDGKSQVEGMAYAKDGGDDSSSGTSGGSGESHSEESSTPAPTTSTEQEHSEVKTETRPNVETHASVGKVRTDIKEGKLRVKFETKEDKVQIQTKVKNEKNETELEAEAEHNAVDEMNTELEKHDVRISTSSGKLAIMNKRAGALSSFPLSVNPTTKELTVTTPSGSKVVTTLPQEAIDNMKASHIIDDLKSEDTTTGLGSAQDLVELKEQDGVLGYQMKGTKTHKFLGIIPVKTNVEAFVSAENGQVVSSTESLLGRILGKLGS